MRDTIIFSGASHTFGLGLEWELDPELNSEEYLQKGIHIPIPRKSDYQKYWKEYRWPTILCKELGYKQFNIHDEENKLEYQLKIGGNAVETIWGLVKNEKFFKELLDKTKYIILEIGHIRWYDEKLHGAIDGDKYPNTILEMIDVINNPQSDSVIVSNTLEWIKQIDPDVYMNELYNKITYLSETYKDITFLILPWHGNHDGLNNSKTLKNNIIPIIENGKKYLTVADFLQKEKLQVWHKAKAFRGKYKFNRQEDHASIEGHKRVANLVMNYINHLEKGTPITINLPNNLI